jgi:outer membrane protein assembly factor BamB
MRHHRLIGRIVACAVLAWAGCGGLALERSLHHSAEDWPTFAMNSERTGSSPASLRPPLRVLWSQDIAGGVGPGSPVVMDSVVMLGTMRGDLYALHAGTGRTLGWINLGEAIYGSPAIERFVAVVALANTRASLVSYDFYSGSVRWKQSYGDIEMTPLQDENRIFVGNLQGLFFAVGVVDGAELWRFTLPDNTQLKGIRSSPALAGATLVFGADDGGIYALNAEDGALRWRAEAGAPVWAAPANAGDLVVVETLEGAVLALELSTGELRWRHQAGSPIQSGALIVRERAVVGTVGGTLMALELQSGRRLWETNTGAPLDAQVVAASGIGYVGTLGRELLAVDLTSGKILWRHTLSGRVKSAGAIAFGQLFVATDDRELVAFREDRQ